MLPRTLFENMGQGRKQKENVYVITQIPNSEKKFGPHPTMHGAHF